MSIDLTKYRYIYDYRVNVSFKTWQQQVITRTLEIYDESENTIKVKANDDLRFLVLNKEDMPIAVEDNMSVLPNLIRENIRKNFDPHKFKFSVYLAYSQKIDPAKLSFFIHAITKGELAKIRHEQSRRKED